MSLLSFVIISLFSKRPAKCVPSSMIAIRKIFQNGETSFIAASISQDKKCLHAQCSFNRVVSDSFFFNSSHAQILNLRGFITLKLIWLLYIYYALFYQKAPCRHSGEYEHNMSFVCVHPLCLCIALVACNFLPSGSARATNQSTQVA